MEVGVAWGYYSEIFINQKPPKATTLLDWYNQDLRCWSWRKFGECNCTPQHTMLYTPETHMEYIKEKLGATDVKDKDSPLTKPRTTSRLSAMM
jgi:hypothetical protein